MHVYLNERYSSILFNHFPVWMCLGSQMFKYNGILGF